MEVARELSSQLSAPMMGRRRRNLARLLAPKSIAVVGASSDPAKAGSQALRSLSNFPGRLVGVHPREKSINGLPCYPTLSAIPEPPDLAILAIPAEYCVAAAEEAAACDVGGILIISGGFGEVGEAGAQRQAKLVDICRSTGLRMLGPNTSGFIHRAAGCVASFVPGVDQLRAGSVAVVAQSGGVNLSVSFLLDRLEAGVSLAVGLGNAVDVDTADILDWLAGDPQTSAVALHLEGVSDGQRLHRAVRRTTARKPVVALVAGRADIGEFAVSHTGNLMGSHQRTVAGLTQAGAVVVDSTEQLAQAAALLRCGRMQPTPAPGFALITGQAGPGLLIVDALKSAGLNVPALADATMARIKSLLPPLTFIKNPIDTGRPGPGFGEVVDAASQDPAIDAVLVFGLHEPAVLDPAGVLLPVARKRRKPVIFGSLGIDADMRSTRDELARDNLPMVESPERLALAAWVLAADARAQWRLGRHRVEEPVETASPPLDGAFDEDRAKALLTQYGIRSPRRVLCRTRAEAREAFRSIGAPVAVKVVAADIAHKTEAGGVHLGVADEASLERALDSIERIPARVPVAFLVEQMAPAGVELIVGGVRDPSWGPCIVIGVGGVLAEAFADTAIRLAPLTADDVAEMLDSLRGKKLLDGFRNLPACNRAAIAEAAIGIGRLLIEHPEIREVEVNPLRVDSSGALALDALVVLEGTDQAAGRQP
ncbi:MAG TPA: acetate--CoA ligase family protein [Burkholderiaceae bacterium]|nr:acetate--CoA ligase family protein [Burkholderiaceae bacterium]